MQIAVGCDAAPPGRPRGAHQATTSHDGSGGQGISRSRQAGHHQIRTQRQHQPHEEAGRRGVEQHRRVVGHHPAREPLLEPARVSEQGLASEQVHPGAACEAAEEDRDADRGSVRTHGEVARRRHAAAVGHGGHQQRGVHDEGPGQQVQPARAAADG